MNKVKLVIILAGLVAAAGQWFPEYYLPLIGGALTVVIGFTLTNQ